MARQKRPRQVDVAQLAGVSTAVVSQVLSGKSGGSIRVGPETRKKVWKAVRELGYVPNPVAQSLARGQSRLIGVFTFESVFPEHQRGFYYPFLLGVEEEAEALGFDLILFTSAGESPGHRSIFGGGSNRLQLADGAVLLGKTEDRQEVARLLDDGFPFVYIGRRAIPGYRVPYVGAAYADATANVVDELRTLGHRHVALLATGDGSESAVDREEGFRRAMAGAGRTSGLRATVLQDLEPTTDTVSALLAEGVTAIVGENDAIARRVHAIAAELGLGVPEHLSIVLLGDPLATDTDGRDWTMFRIPRDAMGREAVRMLIGMIAGDEGPAPQRLLPCAWVPGSTAGPAPAAVR